jgi:hypothetical protein
MTNFDVHVFQLRDGFWGVRIDGLGDQIILKQWPHGKPFSGAEEALRGASAFALDCESGDRSCWS